MNSTLSKEEILENRLGNYAGRWGGSQTVDVLCAMDEYAEQEIRREIIGFSEWLGFNEPKYQRGFKYSCAGKIFDHPPKTIELYDLYTKQKQG